MTTAELAPDLCPLVLETCCTLGDDPDAIAETITAWCKSAEKVAIAAGAIRALSAAAAEALCETALADIRSGPPVAPFDNIMSEAETWAGTASPAELRAYAWASFHALPAESRQRFLAGSLRRRNGGRGMMRGRSIDEQLWRLGNALRGGRLDGWARGFALSLLGQAKRGGPTWEPTPKQAAALDRLLRDAARPADSLIDNADIVEG